MAKYWRYFVGFVTGIIIAIGTMYCATEYWNSVPTFLTCVLCGIPIIGCVLGAFLAHDMGEIWELFVYPLLSIIVVGIVFLVAIIVTEVSENPLHLLWVLPLIGVLIPPTTKIIIVLIDK